jgi:hypothetical protein
MAEQDPPPQVDQVAEIVSSYVRHHKIETDQLAGLIVEVHRALAGLGRAPAAQQSLKPAVPIRRSVQPDYVVCLECGFRAQTLRRHLRVAHGLEVADYRTLEPAGGLSINRAELFGAAHEDRQGDRSRAPRRHGSEPAGNGPAGDPASRAPAEAQTADLTPTVLCALPVNLCDRFR